MKNIKAFLLFFPALNIIADFLFVFEPLRSPISYLRGSVLILVIFIFIFSYSRQIWKLNKAFIIMFIYFSALLLFSSEIDISFPIYIKYFSGIIMFPVFYLLVSNVQDLKKIKWSFFITLFVFVINFVFADIFKLGRGIYSKGEGDFHSGNLAASGVYIGSLLLIAAPIFYSFIKTNSARIIYFIFLISTALILILSMRRTALVMVAIAYIVIAFFYRYKSKLYTYGLIILILSAITISFNFDKIQTRIELRADRFEEGALEKEGRYQETLLIFTDIFSFDDINYTYFGREVFNSAGNYNYPDPTRLIHADYNIIVSGSGLIGLMLYLLFHYKILLILIKQRIKKRKTTIYYLFWVIAIALLVASTAASFSSGLFAITYRTTLYALLGTFAAILNKKIIPVRNLSNVKLVE